MNVFVIGGADLPPELKEPLHVLSNTGHHLGVITQDVNRALAGVMQLLANATPEAPVPAELPQAIAGDLADTATHLRQMLVWLDNSIAAGVCMCLGCQRKRDEVAALVDDLVGTTPAEAGGE